MEWVKCSEKMPDNHCLVMVTVIDGIGRKFVVCDAAYNAEIGFWYFMDLGVAKSFHGTGCTVTHWMDYPEPASD